LQNPRNRYEIFEKYWWESKKVCYFL
jgi:hypothetical protein